jgi:hypothetical protein
MKKCYKSGCNTKATLKCACTAEGVYICKNHFSYHSNCSKTASQHLMQTFLDRPSESEIPELASKLKTLVLSLKNLKDTAITHANEARTIISTRLSELLSIIRKSSALVKEILVRISRNKQININGIQEIATTISQLSRGKENDKSIVFKLKKQYGLVPEIIDDENAIVFRKNAQALLIDLTTFSTSPLVCCPLNSCYPLCVKLSHNRYFVNGGMAASAQSGSYIVNIADKTCENKRHNLILLAGTVLKDDKNIYIWGQS